MQQQLAAHTTVIQVERASASASRQIEYLDEFQLGGGFGQLIIPPPYNVEGLFRYISESNMLKQCIRSYVVNTAGTGWEVVPLNKKVTVDEDERDELEAICDLANSEESLSTVVKKAIAHREAVGFGFIEVIRDISGRPTLLRHASSLHMRLGHKSQTEVLVKFDLPRGARSATVKEFRKFRRFLQLIAGRMRYFKEFGDPRDLNADTGLFEDEQGYQPGNSATEIIHLKRDSNEPYGEPQWINQLPNIIGSREAEEVNMRYFEDNTVPAGMLTVAGGRLTAQSHQNLTNLLAGGIGNKNQSKIVLIEAVGEQDSLDAKGTPIQMKVERLADQRPSDGLFKDYDEANQAKVRSSFRLPSVAVGMANEHNFATANVAMFAAESQVFAPERNETDELLNNTLVRSRAGMRMRTVKLASRTPPITSPEGQIKTMTALNVMGALTPRKAQKLANTLLQIEIEEYPKKGEADYEDWMDKPMALNMSKGAAADEGVDAGNPPPADGSAPATHAGQSVKDPATKALEASGNINTQPKHGTE